MYSKKLPSVFVLTWLAIFAAGSVWADYPIVSQRYAADPAAVEFNGRLYLYCSNDDENGTNGYSMTSLTCFSTDDLKNWTDHGVVFSATSHTTWASLAWAPSVVSNDNKLYLYFGNGASGIGVATSSVPTGPFAEAKGSALINSATPGAATATQWYFDPCAFVDSDGQAYLYFGGQYPTNARVIRLNANLVSVSGAATPMFATNFFEASSLHKRNGTYYYTYCDRFDVGANIYCETNSNPTNGFVPQGVVLANPPVNVYNNNHHAIVSYLGNSYIAYHNRAAAKANGLSDAAAVYKRSLCLDAVNYNADGRIQQVTPTTDGLPQLKSLDPFSRVEAETIAQQSGIKTEVCSEGGLNVGYITNGSWLRVRGVNFGAGAATFLARVASAGSGGNIELHLDSLNGTLVGTCAVTATDGWQTWTTVSTNVSGVAGVHDLYLKFTGGAGYLFNVNWWQFQAGSTASSSVMIEAESGTLGADWAVSNSSSPAYLTILSAGGGGNPTNAARVATYNVTFPAAGTYELFARVRVGAGTFNDDSLFYGNGFGVKSPTTDNDWILVNGLGAAGYTEASNAVVGVGAAGSQVWKWVNLSQFTNGSSESPITFTVPAGNLTQTFQIGAREDGLDIDKLVFGLAGLVFTVSNLDASLPGAPQPPTATIDGTKTYQTIEGFGGATAFYAGWITAHPYKQEIYTNAFAGLNLSMLRLGNWFRYTNSPDTAAFEIVSNANRVLGKPVPVYMSSWAPPAFLKSNGEVGNGGTLAMTNGAFAYTNFANYWYDSLQSYRSNGVSPTWISLQNEPDWEAGYDSCIFKPNEGVVNGTNYASYSKALDATFQRLTNLLSPPKFLAPEPVGIGYNVLQNYAPTLNANNFYGLAYHLYHGSSDGTPDGYITAFRATTNLFPTKPKFMTEYGVADMIEGATLIHNALTEGQVSGYNFWSLVWPVDGLGLIQIEFPWSQSQWTNAPPGTPTQSKGYWLSPSYWSLKHFSYFINPGARRVAATCNDANVRVSAYLSADNLRLVAVFINTSTNTAATVAVSSSSFPFNTSSVYQTAGTNKFQALGAVGSEITLPAASLTTVVLDKFIAVGAATAPSPTNTATGVALDSSLSWTPGNNALTHAVYFGTSSNAVAQATPAAAEFQGFRTNSTFTPALSGSTTYYWRVDEIAGGNTNTGNLWSFSTVPVPALAHRYSFSEANGSTSVADSVGGAAWNGTLPNGGTFSGGELILSSNAQQYVNLPAGILSNLTAVTLEAWATFPANLPWASWFFGFGNTNGTSGGNYLFCSPGGGRFAVAGVSPGYLGETNASTPGLSWSGKTLHLSCVFNPAAGVIAIYTNGVLAGTNSSGTYTMNSIVNKYSFLNRSLYANDPYVNLTLNEFRIYSIALSPAEIAATEALGANQVLSPDPPAVGLATTPTSLTLTWPLAAAGFTVQSRTNLVSGNWVNVTAPAPQIVGGQWQFTVPLSGNVGATYYRLAR